MAWLDRPIAIYSRFWEPGLNLATVLVAVQARESMRIACFGEEVVACRFGTEVRIGSARQAPRRTILPIS